MHLGDVALTRLALPPEQLLQQLGTSLLGTSLTDLPDALLATCVYAVCDPAAGRCSITRASHSPPAVVHPALQRTDRQLHAAAGRPQPNRNEPTRPVTFLVAPQRGAWPPGPVWLFAPCPTHDLGGVAAGPRGTA
ncbi:SpoIIE family protein phosphatase [Streptomyces sp. NPDC056309]|uniref:SpoIIE family protein phosphatase n=1 Tax=unclassified Streptomyces TaxID=2593676 RepID=UPI0035E2ACF0